MASSRLFWRIAVVLVALVVPTSACGRNGDKVSDRVNLPQPTPDRTVDAVVRGIVTLAPLVEATPTLEEIIINAASSDQQVVAEQPAIDQDSAPAAPAAEGAEPASDATDSTQAVAEPTAVPAQPAIADTSTSSDVAVAPSAATPEAVDAQPVAEDTEPALVKPQRGRKARPTATPETDEPAQLTAASAEGSTDEPIPAEPTPAPKKKRS